jgi:hypothetical protein
MKGILKKTTGGFFVWYDKLVDEIVTTSNSLPLHPKSTEGWSVTEREDFFNKFIDKTIEYEIVSETITGEFSAMGGGYTNYQVQFAKPIKPKFDWEYWKHRCLAAEHFIVEKNKEEDWSLDNEMSAYYEWEKWVKDEK